MRLRKLTTSVLAAVLLAAALAAPAAAAAPVTVTVRGTAVEWDEAAPYLEDGRTMVPVRAAAEAMGLEVSWDSAARRVDIWQTYLPENSPYQAELQSGLREFLSRRTVSLWIGQETYQITNQYAVYDGRSIADSRVSQSEAQLDAPAALREGRTCVPIRYVAEPFGYDVLWDGASRTVRIVAGLTADWSYAWSIEPGDDGTLILAIHSPVNVTAAEITAVAVQGEEQTLLEAGSGDAARIYETVGSQTPLLDTVRVAYPFRSGGSYSISFTVTLTKSNGALETAGSVFQVRLP